MGTQVGCGVTKAGFIAGAAVAPDKWIIDFSADNFSTLVEPLGHHRLGLDAAGRAGHHRRPGRLLAHALRLLRHDGHGHRRRRRGRPGRTRTASCRASAACCSSTRLARSPAVSARTSSNTTYIESAAGVSEGGRTGFAVGRHGPALPGGHPVRADRRHRARGGHRSGPGRRRLPDVHDGQGDRRGATSTISSRPWPIIIVMPLTYSITNGIGAGFVGLGLPEGRDAASAARSTRSCGSSARPSFSTSPRPGSRIVVAREPLGLVRRPALERAPAASCQLATGAVRGCHRLAFAAMYERTALPDGPRVITSRLAGARSVSIAAYVLAGSRLESAEEAGAAHFMEHITFKGTAAYPDDAGRLGGDRGRRRQLQRRHRPRVHGLLGSRAAARGRRAAWTSWAS